MLITLRIENADRMPEGSSAAFTARGSFVIGREGDWTLPDPDKIVSGRHCDVRYEAGAFWLHDVSRNGTFVNGSPQRLAAAHRLAHGDRLRIGRYIISVSLEVERHAGAHAGASTEARSAASASAGSSVVLAAEPFVPRQPGPAPHDALPQRPVPHPLTSAPDAKGDELLRCIAEGAGISPETLQHRDPHEVGREIGVVLRLVVEELAQLLKARAAAKVLSKSGHRTMIGSVDNNPLKFVPTAEEMLDIMFARRRAGYLDAKGSIAEAFRDLKSHELATYAAMQTALAQLLEDLSPEAIEKKVPPSAFSSTKGRAWDAFVATWTAREEAHENGMLDVFLAYFSEAYAKASRQK